MQRLLAELRIWFASLFVVAALIFVGAWYMQRAFPDAFYQGKTPAELEAECDRRMLMPSDPKSTPGHRPYVPSPYCG